MTKSRVVPLRIPESLYELASLNAQEQHTDKSTALRRWLHEGAAHYVVNLVAEGRISVGRAAELLEASPHDIYRIAESRGIELGATAEQRRQSREVASKLTQESETGTP